MVEPPLITRLTAAGDPPPRREATARRAAAAALERKAEDVALIDLPGAVQPTAPAVGASRGAGES